MIREGIQAVVAGRDLAEANAIAVHEFLAARCLAHRIESSEGLEYYHAAIFRKGEGRTTPCISQTIETLGIHLVHYTHYLAHHTL